jgi:hypothetical protein
MVLITFRELIPRKNLICEYGKIEQGNAIWIIYFATYIIRHYSYRHCTVYFCNWFYKFVIFLIKSGLIFYEL